MAQTRRPHTLGWPVLAAAVAVIAAVSVAVPARSEAPNCTPSTWTAQAPNPTPRYGNTGTSNGTFFYSISGSTIAAMITNVDRYDPVANTWAPMAPIPIAIQDAPSIHLAGKIYVFGGLNSVTNAVINNVQIYDIATNTWSSGAPIPAVRFGSYAGTFNNKIYVAGGFPANDINTGTNTTFQYDVATNSWTTLATMPNVNALGAYATSGNFLYTFGGWRGNPCCNSDSYRYDMATNTWTTIANLPTAVEGSQAGVTEGEIWIAGGGTPFEPNVTKANLKPGFVDALGLTQVYHPASNTYVAGPAMTQARTRFAGNNVVSALVTGGYTGTAVSGSTETNTCAVPVSLQGVKVE
jgi:N-acetylneuraminic acid mutarotase